VAAAAMSRLPESAHGPLRFEAVNAASWSVILGAPMLVYLKAHGAPAVVLGLALSLSPLLQILQPVGARLLPRFGYRGLMVRGWVARTVVTVLVAVVAWWSLTLGAGWTVALTMALLTTFSLIRGVASGAWMPWITQLVPEDQRGRFLATNQVLVTLTTLVCLAAYAWVLDRLPGVPGFTLLFLWSAVLGWVASWVLARIPDRPVAAEGPPGSVAWRELLRHRPFRALLLFDLVAWSAFAGAGVLWVPVLRDLHHCSDGFIALMPVWAGLAGVATLLLLGSRLDRVGSRPVLAVAVPLLALHFGLWAALAAGWVPLGVSSIAAIQISGGAGFSAWAIANTRLAMSCIPPQGRSHFFALHGAVAALGYGVMPVLWGAALDLLEAHGGRGWSIPGHAWLYLAMAGLGLAALRWHRHLVEPAALPTRVLLAELCRLPGRALARWWPDRP